MNDEEALRLAFDLAENAEGDTSPNPIVGAVLTRDGEVVGRGYHRSFGGPHAEIYALEEAGECARGATLYVTLEPCAHHGKTPPCTERLIAAGIARVVVPVEDPNPLVSGRGVAALRAAGIEVEVGLLREVAERQNEIFFTFIATGVPFVHLKLAVSLDGRIATRAGDARWITGEPARALTHRWRRRHAAILVGSGTVLADNPELSVRYVAGRQPVPIVLDAGGRVPLSSRVLDPTRRPIVVTSGVLDARRAELEAAGVRVWDLPGPGGEADLHELLVRLGQVGIDSLLVEGGGETAASFLAADLVDRVSFLIAPILIGGRDAVPSIGGAGSDRLADAIRLSDVTATWVGSDLVYSGLVKPRRT